MQATPVFIAEDHVHPSSFRLYELREHSAQMRSDVLIFRGKQISHAANCRHAHLSRLDIARAAE
jgi:hypothetical protein